MELEERVALLEDLLADTTSEDITPALMSGDWTYTFVLPQRDFHMARLHVARVGDRLEFSIDVDAMYRVWRHSVGAKPRAKRD